MDPHRRSSAAPTRQGAVTTPFQSDAAGGGRSGRWRRQEPADEEAGAGDEGSRWAATAEAEAGRGRRRRRQRRSEAAEDGLGGRGGGGGGDGQQRRRRRERKRRGGDKDKSNGIGSSASDDLHRQ
nr:unnamed protein product [Digitaria exilis]